MFEEGTNVETYQTWFALVRMKFLRGTCAKLHSTPRWKEVEKEEKIETEHVVDASIWTVSALFIYNSTFVESPLDTRVTFVRLKKETRWWWRKKTLYCPLRRLLVLYVNFVCNVMSRQNVFLPSYFL